MVFASKNFMISKYGSDPSFNLYVLDFFKLFYHLPGEISFEKLEHSSLQQAAQFYVCIAQVTHHSLLVRLSGF